MKNKKITKIFKEFNLLELFILLSPFIDLITSFSMRFLKLNITFGMIIRFIFLFILLYYIFFKSNSKYKKSSIIYLIIMFLFVSSHIFNIYLIKGFRAILIEFKILIKIFYFPIVLLSLFNYFDENKDKNKVNPKTFNILSIIYLIFILIPIITKTSSITYPNGKKGYIGWFYSPNEIGAILAIISPFIIAKVMVYSKKWCTYILLALYVFVMFQIGTKVPFLGVFLSVLVYFVVYIIRYILDKENKPKFFDFLKKPLLLPLGLSLLIIILLYRFSVVNTNINYHKEMLVQKNAQISELRKEDYKTLVFSGRDKYNDIMMKKFKLSNLKEQLFGLGYQDKNNQFNRSVNIIEIDYGDVFYLYGVYGFIIYFIFLFIILIDIMLSSIKKIKLFIFDEDIIPYYISVALILGVAFFAGHIFTAPAVSLYSAIIIPMLYFKTSHDDKNITNKVNIFLKKYWGKIIIAILTVFIITFVFGIYYSKKVPEINLRINNSIIEGNSELKLIDTKTINDNYDLKITDKISDYEYLKNKVYFRIRLVERTFENDDKFLMFTIDNHSRKKVNFKIEKANESKDNIKFLYNFKENEIIKEYNTTVGYDKTTLPINYIEYMNNNSILISKGFKYNNLITSYGGSEKSKLKELIEENENVIIEKNYLVHDFVLDSLESYDCYFVLSKNKLFNNKNSIDLYIEMLNGAHYTSWLAYDGSYHKLPYSIEPFTREGYGRNPGAIAAKQSYKNYLRDNSKIFYDLVVNSSHILLNYMPRDKSGVWFTEYTSTWLKKDYDIRAPYIDTRHNEGIGNYLYKIGTYLDNLKIKESYFDYADYLIENYNQDDIIKFEEGFLFPDYFSYNHEKNTHASLNNQLGIINYLLNSFIRTGNKEFKKIGLSMLNTIEKQSSNWIRDDKDLWYQINEKNQFDGRDYKLLTLDDLLYTQKYLVLAGENKSKEVTKLIKSKYDYLNNINYNIPDHIVERIFHGDY